MVYQYLLDTNIISDLVRHPQGQIFQRISAVGEVSICTSIIVACELRFGAEKTGSARLINQIESIDLLIAAYALALDLTLVTANTREFSRVSELQLENWLS